MQNLLNDLKQLLEKDDRLMTEGKLLKNKVVELALKLDKNLIKLLLSHKDIKRHFFTEVGDTLVFDKDKFIKFVSNKQFLPDSYTAFKNKIGLTAGDEFISEKSDVSLVWPYKDCVLQGGQTKEDVKRRDEIFWNEILAPDEIDRLLSPKVFTNAKMVDKNGEHEFQKFDRWEDGTISNNLIIKGNNLLALYSLKKHFAKKVDLIYIDPPYNPNSAANTFLYNNKFNHSSWLTFMRNRIQGSKGLLKDESIFCVAIDHNELFYLGVLCDELLGRDNRLGIIAVETNKGGRSDSKFFATSHEYFFIYAKNKEKAEINDLKLSEKELKKKYDKKDSISRYQLVPLRRTGSNSTPDKRPNLYYPIFYNPENNGICLSEKQNYIKILPIGSDNTKRVWRWSKEKVSSNINNITVRKVKGHYDIYEKKRIKDGKKPKTMWYDSKYDAPTHGTKLLQEFDLDVEFSYPKSLHLMKDIIQILANKDGIILDYFAGSGTTAQAVLDLNKEDGGNRQFILCEQMDYVQKCTMPRLKKVFDLNNSEESLAYLELKKWNQEFIEKIEKAGNKRELEKLWKEMQERAFLSWKLDFEKLKKNAKEFRDLSLENQKKFLLEVLDQNQLYVNYSEIEDEMYGVSEEDKKLNKEFYEK